ncbi:hypothetical protein LCGC14_1566420, partial [marine sediment metagenome]
AGKRLETPDEKPPVSIDRLTDQIMENAMKDFQNKPDVQSEFANLFDMSKTVTSETNEMLDILWDILRNHIKAKKDQISSLKGLFNSMSYLTDKISNPIEVTGSKGAVLFTTMNDFSNKIETIVAEIAIDYAKSHKVKTGIDIHIDIASNTTLVAEGLLESLMTIPTQKKITKSLLSYMKDPKMAVQLEEASNSYEENVKWFKDHLRNVLSFAVEGTLLKSSEKRWISELLDEFIIQLDEKAKNIETGGVISFPLNGKSSHLVANGLIEGIKTVLWKIFMILTLVTWISSLAYGTGSTMSEDNYFYARDEFRANANRILSLHKDGKYELMS